MMSHLKQYESPEIYLSSFDSLSTPLCASDSDPYSGNYSSNPSMDWGDSGEQTF